jgi:lysophospholipase L1-like esterase
MFTLKIPFIALVLLNLILLIFIAFIARHYAWLDKLLLRLQQHRLAAPSYQHNPNYLLYTQLFRAYKVQSPHIVFLGDSMVAIPDWSRLISNPSINIANMGIPGDTIEGLTARIPDAVQTNPQAIILWIGINDILQGASPHILTQRYRSLFSALQSFPGPIALIALAPVSSAWENHHTINATVQATNRYLAQSIPPSWHFIQIPELTSPDTLHLLPQFTSDGLHLSAQGYLTIVQNLHTYIAKIFPHLTHP